MGSIDTPFVYLTDQLIQKFNDIWNYYIGDSPYFKPDICKPYYHLQHEPFWRNKHKVNRTDRCAKIPTCTWKMHSASVSDTLPSSQVVRLPVVLTKLPSYWTLLKSIPTRLWLILGSAKAIFTMELHQEDLIKVRSKEKDLKKVVESCEGWRNSLSLRQRLLKYGKDGKTKEERDGAAVARKPLGTTRGL